jgi:hypothetical protein
MPSSNDVEKMFLQQHVQKGCFCGQENTEWQHAKEEEWQECFIADSRFVRVIVTNQVKAIQHEDDQGMPKGHKFISAL